MYLPADNTTARHRYQGGERVSRLRFNIFVLIDNESVYAVDFDRRRIDQSRLHDAFTRRLRYLYVRISRGLIEKGRGVGEREREHDLRRRVRRDSLSRMRRPHAMGRICPDGDKQRRIVFERVEQGGGGSS